MRWRFIDRITGWNRWTSIEGVKAVSLEEYSLLEAWGRRGVLPESLVVESCLHLSRWLVMASSEFSQTCALGGIEHFRFDAESRAGDAIAIRARALERSDSTVVLSCRASAGSRPLAEGVIAAAVLPIGSFVEGGCARTIWRELFHGKTP